MGRIHLLDPQVAEKIAAGEVITRPGAAVKELVENALDAGARTITVEIVEGGRKLIRVADDGCGMSSEDLGLSLKRHATSKLASEADLLSIATLGFRGEALPSLAAVSRLELISRRPDAASGWRLVAVGGAVAESGPWAGAPGTQVTVTELFFNTPARRKFLKGKDTEQAFILETLRALALGFPEVGFFLQTPGRTLLAAPACRDLRERVAAVYGAELAARMLPVALGDRPWQVSGLATEPDFSLASSRFQVFLVNRRAVQDRLLPAVLKEAYRGLLSGGRHPGAVVNLSAPLDQVDVNVHPAKAEVRFQDPGRVYALLLAGLRQTLGPFPSAGPVYQVAWQPAPSPAREPTPPLPWHPPAPGAPPAAAPPLGAGVGEWSTFGPGWRFQDLKILGQLDATYILAQGPPGGLILIDQHAAHERVLYEAFQAGYGEAARQALLFPRVIEVNPVQADWVKGHLQTLAQAGLELAPFGGGSFLLSAAPAVLAKADLEAVVLDIIEALAPVKSHTHPQALKETALLVMACRGAIKAGEVLAPEEMHALLKQLDEIPVNSHCPHGRPLWRLISSEEINRSFRRPKA
ncbi:MAG: DNA mismatch repair endonuclease MutL [Deltaproteobacteria bacterium]|nr:DNA mismatch repair endonuclease MutL [Deltaproteobacteria bacterium]